MIAAVKGQLEIMKLLLDEGAEVNATNEFEGTVLQHAVYFCDRDDRVRLLLDRGADVNAKAGMVSTALLAAVSSRNHRIIKLLLDHGADVEAGHRGLTPLVVAVHKGQWEVVEMLLEYGADFTRIDERTPLPPHLRLWKTAALGTAYDNLSSLSRDMGVDITTFPLTYDWEIPAVLKSAEGLGCEAYQTFLEKLVVIVGRKSTVSPEQDWNPLKATTCSEYLERQWNMLGTQLLQDIIYCLKDIAVANSEICKKSVVYLTLMERLYGI